MAHGANSYQRIVFHSFTGRLKSRLQLYINYRARILSSTLMVSRALHLYDYAAAATRSWSCTSLPRCDQSMLQNILLTHTWLCAASPKRIECQHHAFNSDQSNRLLKRYSIAYRWPMSYKPVTSSSGMKVELQPSIHWSKTSDVVDPLLTPSMMLLGNNKSCCTASTVALKSLSDEPLSHSTFDTKSANTLPLLRINSRKTREVSSTTVT